MANRKILDYFITWLLVAMAGHMAISKLVFRKELSVIELAIALTICLGHGICFLFNAMQTGIVSYMGGNIRREEKPKQFALIIFLHIFINLGLIGFLVKLSFHP